MDSMNDWKVDFSPKASRQLARLEKEQPDIYASASTLVREIEIDGPIRRNWSHFSGLRKGPGIPDDSYHCHIKDGKPTFVACWTIEDKKVKIVEVYYVGTHEKAPY
jgi:hypothetical protein